MFVCAPHVLEHVRRQLTKGDLMYMAPADGGSGPAGGSARSGETATGSGRGADGNGSFSFRRVLDLTHTLSPRFPVFPAFEPMQVTTNVTIEEDGFFARTWEVGEHTGTHMDAPAHFAAGEGIRTADEIPVEDLIAPLAVIDISERAAADHDAQLTVDDVLAYEAKHGRIAPGAAVTMYTGWETRAHGPEFLNADDGGTMHFPGLTPEVGRFLAEERDVIGVGVDTISLDFGPSTDFRAHYEILSRNKWGLECLANLAEAPPAGALLFVGAPKVLGASGGPCRVLALW